MNILYNSLPSTNAEAKRHIDCGASPYNVIIAQKQTHGVGRNGHAWWSPEDCGLYMSVIAKIPPGCLDLITENTGYRILVKLREITCLDLGMRGINDIYLADRKLAGILCEIYKNHLIIGLGMNLYRPSRFPIKYRSLAKTGVWLNEYSAECRWDIKSLADAIAKELM